VLFCSLRSIRENRRNSSHIHLGKRSFCHKAEKDTFKSLRYIPVVGIKFDELKGLVHEILWSGFISWIGNIKALVSSYHNFFLNSDAISHRYWRIMSHFRCFISWKVSNIRHLKHWMWKIRQISIFTFRIS